MYIKKYLLIIFLSWLFILPAFTQNHSPAISEKARKYYEQAEPLMFARKFDQAIAVLNKAVEKEPQYAEAYYRLGNIHELLQNDVKALENYARSVELKPNHKPFIAAYYALGNIAMRKGNYEQAKGYYESFIELKPAKPAQFAEAKRNLANAMFAIEAKQHPLPFSPKPLSKAVNKFALQYFPVLTADQQTLIFTARDTTAANDDENLYVSYQKNGEWTSPISLSSSINTPENEGTCSISADGRTLVFTSCKGRESFGSCDLFVTYKVGEEWTMPINLGGKINTSSWESQPSLSADGRTLYFTSDRRGGYGKRDIWMSQLGEDGVWGTAINLGTAVNTPDDDLSPFIHVNGTTFFFSSKGHLGLGGFDLFATEKTGNNTWARPKNLGYPINTHDDQVSLFVTADGKKGYYSHEEKRGRQYLSSVLHEFELPEQIAMEHTSDYLKGTVYDAQTKQKIGARLELFNLNSGNMDALMQADRKTGEYLTVLTQGASYALYVNKEGYLFKSLYFDFNQKKEHEPLVLDIYLEPVRAGAKDILNNLFFATGEFKLENKSKTELDKLIGFLNENKSLRMEISGHTDDIGKDEDNLELSRKRAKSVYDYLLNAGVNANRLKYAGYGETQFVAPNTSDKNRQLNRRIEFKVL
jgi:outer membrane protein OmpA-like peptidoglycan-associated protein